MRSSETVKPTRRVIPIRTGHDRRREELAFLPAALEIVETPPSPIGRIDAYIDTRKPAEKGAEKK